ncbi:MAG TPA: cytochrome B, partial [Bacteroidota bacterium]
MHLNIKLNQWRAGRFLFLFAALLVLPLTLLAQTSADCLGCHSEPSLSTTRKGKTVPLFVDGKKFTASVHGSLECVACHEGFDPQALPHKKSIKPVQCQNCHTDGEVEKYNKSVHGTLTNGKSAVACSDCHSMHEIRKLTDAPPAERKAYAETVCARCHKDTDAKYRTSAHGTALAGGMAGAPSCIDCHDMHAVMAPADSAATTSRRHIAAMCLKCHRDDPEVRAKVGPSAAFIASYENSVHARAVKSGKEEAATCIDCHGAHELQKGTDPASRVSRKNIAETCGGCHIDVVDQYNKSIHGTAL